MCPISMELVSGVRLPAVYRDSEVSFRKWAALELCCQALESRMGTRFLFTDIGEAMKSKFTSCFCCILAMRLRANHGSLLTLSFLI